MKDTVTRITFFVGGVAGVGGASQRVPFCFFGFLGGGQGMAWPRTQSFFCVPGFT